MMVVAYVFLWDIELHPGSLLGWVLQPFLLQGWDPAPNVYAGGNGPTWSLSCEFFFYAMFPLVIMGVRRLRARGIATAAAAVIVVMIAIPAAVGPHVSPQTYTWLFFYLPGYRFGEFLIGMLLARAVSLGLRFPRPSIGYLLGWAWFLLWDVEVSRYTMSHHGTSMARPFAAMFVLPCFVLLLIAAASADLSHRARLMRSWLPVRLGEWSFALYMVHDPLVALITHHGWLKSSGESTGFGYMLIFIAGCTLAAVGAHYLVEKPVERWLRRRALGRRKGTMPRHRKGQAVPMAVP